MLNEELKEQILQSKLTYLNGYLDALALVCSYSIIGMNFRLFNYKYYSGDIERAIRYNSTELFNVGQNEFDIELIETKNWEELLKNELYANLKRRIPFESPAFASQLDYKENNLVMDLNYSIRNSINYFIMMLKNEFINETVNVYELKVSRTFHRIVGIDLIFEIEPTKMILLQIRGMD